MRSFTKTALAPVSEAPVSEPNFTDAQNDGVLNRVIWNSVLLKQVLDLFETEIRERNIKLDIVKMKMLSCPQLKKVTPRQVYDRLRKHVSENLPSVALPIETETVSQKVDRLTDSMHDDHFDPSIVRLPVQSRVKDMFNPGELYYLCNACKQIISHGSISKNRIIEKRH